jgi:hypothetical protein
LDIEKKKILILGGWGLVGSAIIRKLVQFNPDTIVILSLKEIEAVDVCNELMSEYSQIKFLPEWGNIFVRNSLKDLSRNELLNNRKYRQALMVDTMEAFDDQSIQASFLNQVISRHKPNIIIDTVNTATALAYQDLYSGYYNLKREMKKSLDHNNSYTKEFHAEVEKTMTTLYIPQIIRHIQILHKSMVDNKTGVYIKIGTTGTGGMGLNIPYTHSEEQPSRILLSKTALAGAHTMLLFLMGRTPGGPIIKEIKPAAAIAWKAIQFGEINKRGKPIQLYDCTPENATLLNDKFYFSDSGGWKDLNETLKSVYIDTGENGIFSQGEFETITSIGQMEFVTPEEIADNVILEILGDSTGHDVINALNNSIMGPTYRAGYLRHKAMESMIKLQKQYNADSVAFEILGPPRLSKILYEAYLLKLVSRSFMDITNFSATALSEKTQEILLANKELRSKIISIGIPILLNDGKRLLRGPEIKIPVPLGKVSIEMNDENINEWAYAGWVDLRIQNMKVWIQRFNEIYSFIRTLEEEDTSSRFHHGQLYWKINQPINIGKLAAWIFINEDKGLRIKG